MNLLGGVQDETSSKPCRSRNVTHASQSDLHLRLGLLLGDECTNWDSLEGRDGTLRQARPADTGSCHMVRCSQSPARSTQRGHRRGPSGGSASTLLPSPSLTSLEPSRPPHGGADGGTCSSRFGTSSNTSPASTLT
ncbi:hypothetical protein J437_LFUL012095, partial [Ladona fulva]